MAKKNPADVERIRQSTVAALQPKKADTLDSVLRRVSGVGVEKQIGGLDAMDTMDALLDRKLPRKKATADKPCGCGCGSLVARRFAVGHDAKLHGLTKRVAEGVVDLSEIGHAGIRAAVEAELKRTGRKAFGA